MIFPYIDNDYFLLFPRFPTICEKPPTVYSILESIVNYDKEDKTKIRNLAKEGRETIFNFDYPLSDTITKEEFETMILNHFLQRRIGFETVTAFQIQLCTKLNEIMPMYNKMFDVIKEWNIFESEKIIHDATNNRKVDNIMTNESKTTNELQNESNTENETISDRRNSELPQNQLELLQDGSYVSNYNYDKDNANSHDLSTSNGTSNSNQNETNKTNDDNILHEVTTKTSPELMYQYMEKMKNVYTMIFKDLDCLFYQVIL